MRVGRMDMGEVVAMAGSLASFLTVETDRPDGDGVILVVALVPITRLPDGELKAQVQAEAIARHLSPTPSAEVV
jgi:hypothetical protein